LILLLAAACASGQIIGFPFPFPGGGGRNPNGGGGGSPFPGGRRTNSNNGPVQTLDGMLRRISSSELVLESDDNLVTTVSLSSGTRYYLQPSDVTSGNGNNPPSTAKRADFQAGDHVTVDATQDNNSYYRATRVVLVSTGTAADKDRAARPVDAPSSSSSRGDSRSNSGNSSSDGSNNDDDRPRLHRAGQSDSSSSSSSTSPTSTPSSNSSSTQSSNNNSDSDQPPTLRRSSASSRPATTSNTDDPVQTASASRPSIHADDVGGVTRLPDAPAVADDDRDSVRSSPRRSGPAGGDDPVIENAREAAFSFVETLPNYVVKQFTTRYGTEAARGGKTSWRAIDTVTADVVSENGTEAYKNILVNGKPPREAIEKTGAWSTGEYASLLQDVLAPQTDADFHGQRATTIVNRAAYRYDFTVQRTNSHWHVYAASESYTPEYNGTIWIDKQNYRVLRIELSAQKLPRTFLLDTVESAVDYDYFTIGDGKFLLPAHSEALSCVRGTGECTRNVIDFRNYKKFSAETSITFDADK
jgi:hypothetical protein